MSIKIVFAARLLILIQLKFQICNLLKPKSKNTDILSLKDKNALCSLLKIEEDRGVCKQNLIMAYAIKNNVFCSLFDSVSSSHHIPTAMRYSHPKRTNTFRCAKVMIL